MGSGQKGPGKPIFSPEIIEKHRRTAKIVEKSYKIDAKTTTQGGAAEGGACCFLHLFCVILHLCLAVHVFSMISAKKMGFPGHFCPGPIWGVTKI